MKPVLTLIFCSLFFTSVAQDKKVHTVEFCGEMFEVPEGCFAETVFGLDCPDFSIKWMYLEEDMLTFAPQQYLRQLDEKLKRFKKRPITLESMGEAMEAYWISYRENKVERYRIVAFGTINNHPVLMDGSLKSEVNSNEDVPPFLRQFISVK